MQRQVGLQRDERKKGIGRAVVDYVFFRKVEPITVGAPGHTRSPAAWERELS